MFTEHLKEIFEKEYEGSLNNQDIQEVFETWVTEQDPFRLLKLGDQFMELKEKTK